MSKVIVDHQDPSLGFFKLYNPEEEMYSESSMSEEHTSLIEKNKEKISNKG